VLDHTIFAGRIHGLKDQQYCPAVLGIKRERYVNPILSRSQG
jgi:hypothetical protein